ncbi:MULTISPECIES: argininosuccinate lyase [Methanocorpusculum]|jgi:argininosuccinate lyase|uniref:Argininosuccinate lyase n=1 Tax=Methanocorpusculum parvum TaxID=2193 RepID=A0AAX0Q7Y9_9EURY|nr:MULTISPECIES: argininosuccinate lyase [Methanocorpusculum]MDD2248230.1 argininosuccinate lyase [Methanocorpusculum sp.]MDD3046612.1 argininosuccinate lyase [Methanocorpusculum sp.]MDD3912075.1 argininosuccinate lyase [Methanocorpusculum sp.]MDD4423189.1 argininosuccinate lyase [Methanocorpusculum parvum]MDY3201807.1 argininosuccinate lyase [Methanocorpusculum sp.]
MAKDQIRNGRLEGGRSALVEQYLSSMEADREIADSDIRVDIAHILMLRKQDLIDAVSAKKLLTTLLGYMENGLPADVFDMTREDIHAGIEAQLMADAGSDAGGRMHLGRSRNDEVATCLRMRTRELLIDTLTALFELRQSLISRAEEHTTTIMPGFTHLQHAQPTTLAHYLLAYESLFARDTARLFDAYTRVNISPLGSAAFAGTGFAIDRNLTAAYLGFANPMENSMDAVANRDFIAETLSSLAILMTNISRICEELILWSTSFVRFVDLNDAYCSTSSIMPQKKNPDTLEIMRAKSAAVIGELTAALTLIKSLPMSYNRDLQDLNPHLWNAFRQTNMSLPLLAEIISTAEFNVPVMKKQASAGNTTATELADFLVREYGIPFRTAHNIVGRAVKLGSLELDVVDAAAKDLASISLKEKGLTEETIKKVLHPATILRQKQSFGSPNPKMMKKAVKVADIRLVQDQVTADILQDQLRDADEKMKTAIQELDL